VERKNKSNTSNKRGNLNPQEVIKKVSNIPGNHEIKNVQNTAILDTSHILREVLILTYRTLNMRNKLNVPQIVTTE
jgi:hypothetical protein